MNILFTMTGSWGTGSGTVVEAVSRELMRQGHHVMVFLPEAKGEGEEQPEEFNPDIHQHVWRFPVQENAVELYTYPLMISDPNPSNYRGAWTFRDLTQDQMDLYVRSFQHEFASVVRTFQPDVIECEHVWLMAYAVARLNLPFVAVAHHSDQMGFHFDPRMQTYAREAAQRASYVFAISNAVREDVLRLYDLEEERVPVIFNGFDQEVFRPCPVDREELLREFGLEIPADAQIVTFAGKLSKTKGIDLLLLANRTIQAERSIHFVIFGTGTLEDALEDDRRDEYSLENVHLLGHCPYATIARFHNLADFSIMPSRTEGFGIAALEAMGCALPLVITRAGGVDEFAVGEVIDPGDVGAISDAVLRLAALPAEELRQMGVRAREAALGFSWAAITDERVAYYREMIQPGTGDATHQSEESV